MKLSKREKSLLVLLAFSLVLYLFHRFVYLPKTSVIQALEADIMEERAFKARLQKTVGDHAGLEASIRAMKLRAGEMDRILPVTIHQEEIIVYLQDMFDAYGLEASVMNFSTGVLEDASREDDAPDSIELLLEEYESGKRTKSLEELKNPGNPAEETVPPPPAVKRFDVSLGFSGTYGQVKEFLDKLESNPRLIGVQAAGMTSEDGLVRGTMTLGFPFYNDGTLNRLEWFLDRPYGRSNPFETGNSLGYAADLTEFARSDFYLFIDSPDEGLSSATLGKTPYNHSAIYSDGSKLGLTLREEDGLCRFRYESGSYGYPGGDPETFEPFMPGNTRIVLNVYIRADARFGASEGTLLEIRNETDRTLLIHVMGDDPDAPLFQFDVLSGEVEERRF